MYTMSYSGYCLELTFVVSTKSMLYHIILTRLYDNGMG